MLLPLGTDRQNARPTLVTYGLVAACIAGYMAQLLTGWGDEDTGPLGALMVQRGAAWYTYLTSAFLHGDIIHLLGNMLFLWVFGPNVEDRFGRLGFLGFYLLGAIASAYAHVAFSPAPAIGASGAISAVTGAFLVLFPLTKMRILLFFFIIGVYMIPSWWLIVFQIATNLFKLGMDTNVAIEAHLGGYAYGSAVAFVLLATGVLSREPYDLFSIARQRARRRQFEEAARIRDVQIEKRLSKKPAPENEAMLEARAKVSRAVAEGDPGGAVTAYLELLREHGKDPAAGTLSRGAMYAVANRFFETGDHTNAAAAYERFLAAYPTDNEAQHVRVLLALVNARYLNDPTRAAELLREIDPARLGPDEASLVATLKDELGISPDGAQNR